VAWVTLRGGGVGGWRAAAAMGWRRKAPRFSYSRERQAIRCKSKFLLQYQGVDAEERARHKTIERKMDGSAEGIVETEKVRNVSSAPGDDFCSGTAEFVAGRKCCRFLIFTLISRTKGSWCACG